MTISAPDTLAPNAVAVSFVADTLVVVLADGRSLGVPLDWYPRIAEATDAERANWRLVARGSGIHWPDIEEDISIAGLIAGRRSQESAASLARWRASRGVR